MFCIGYTDTLTLSVPLQVLKSLAADFDGDVLNVIHIISDSMFTYCRRVFNPRECMYISRIDGKVNGDLLPQRDTLINANTYLWLGRHNYNDKNLEKIAKIKERQKEYFMEAN